MTTIAATAHDAFAVLTGYERLPSGSARRCQLGDFRRFEGDRQLRARSRACAGA